MTKPPPKYWAYLEFIHDDWFILIAAEKSGDVILAFPLFDLIEESTDLLSHYGQSKDLLMLRDLSETLKFLSQDIQKKVVEGMGFTIDNQDFSEGTIH